MVKLGKWAGVNNMRTVVLDTETTGLSPQDGHKIVEVGCIELVNAVPTGNIYHQYLDPKRDIPVEAFRVHGLSIEFLSEHPIFADIAEKFLAFVGDSNLIIHNAKFDISFINNELDNVKLKPISFSRAIDTIELARKKFPGSPVNLDALCKRFNIDNSERGEHGALKDARLLAQVYLELIGGRQADLSFTIDQGSLKVPSLVTKQSSDITPVRHHAPSNEELENHECFIATIKNPVWRQ